MKPIKAMGLAALFIALMDCGESGGRLPVKELTVTGDGVTLYVRIVGDPEAGSVLIVNHGGPGLCSHYLASLEELASGKLAVVTYDQRGSCRSSLPTTGYGMERFVADLEAVRTAVGVDSVHVLGHSWGGLLSMVYAAEHPERVRSLVLMGSGAPDWSTNLAGAEHRGGRIMELQQAGFIPLNIASLEAILPSYFSDPAFERPAELQVLHYNPTVEQETFAALGQYDFTVDVNGIEAPVLLVWGEDDPFGLPMAEATQHALTCAEVEFVVLEGCGHFWQEQPEAFFERVREFLGRVEKD